MYYVYDSTHTSTPNVDVQLQFALVMQEGADHLAILDYHSHMEGTQSSLQWTYTTMNHDTE